MKIALRADSVVKRYKNHQALTNVSLEIPEQSIYGLLGPNGAGKTSLIRIINQITGPDSGAIYINGESLKPSHIGTIGYLPEERGLYKKMKVGEQIVYLAQLKGLSKADAKAKGKKWCEKLEISHLWNRKVEELSKGMAQKIQFISTVVHNPKLLILDEPFSGFDPINTNLIKEQILELKNEGATIMLATHNMGTVEDICESIALINNSKKVLDGSVKQIQKDFSESKYEVSFKGNVMGFANVMWGGFEVLDKFSEDRENHTFNIKLLNGITLNSFLKEILPVCEIKSVREVVPTMSEVFIATVNKEKEAENE